MEFWRVTLQSENEGSRSFAFEAEDVRDETNIGNVFAADMGEEWFDCEIAPLDLDGSIMELCTF